MKNKIADILKEATNGQIDESVLADIEQAFEKRLEEKTTIHVEKALLEQDELYLAKLKQLLEAIDKDRTKKLVKVMEAVDKDKTNKLKAVIKKYEKVLNEDANTFKQQLVSTVSQYLDAYIAEAIPADEIKEAVRNKKAITVLENLREHLAVDKTVEKESVRNAILDGKDQINEANKKLESALQEKAVIEEELQMFKANALIEEKTADLDERSAKYIKKMLTGKPLDYIEENFDYTLKLFEKKKESRRENLKTEALNESVKVDHVKPIEENRQVNNPYMSELSKY